MKKITTLLLVILITQNISNAQSLSNWKQYYTFPYYYTDFGNFLTFYSGGQLKMFDKATHSTTRIPGPIAVKILNPHVTNYMPYVTNGPDNSMLLTCKALSTSYYYDGFNWLPVTNYQGFNLNTLHFLPYKGGSNYFYINAYKIYKYDGNTLSFFDSTNCPFDITKFWLKSNAPNDDLFMWSTKKIAVYHNSSWSLYDTSYFNNAQYISTQVLAVDNNGDCRFVNTVDSSLNIFSQNTGSWTSIPVPPALIHSTYGFQGYCSWYDSNGDLWFMGLGIYFRFDGNQFYDYYNNLYALIGKLYSNTYLASLTGDDIIILVGQKNYIYNPYTNVLNPIIDPLAKVNGNLMFSCLKDSSGNLWFGGGDNGQQNGLVKFDGTNWSYPPLQAHDIHGPVLCITQDTGSSIVIGSDHFGWGGPVQLYDTSFISLDTTGQVNRVKDVAIDENHHYWFGGEYYGLAELYNGVLNYYYPSGISNYGVYALEIDTLNNLWVSFEEFDRVYKFDGTTWTSYASVGFSDTIVEIRVDRKTNSVWLCSLHNGFEKYNNGLWTLVNMSNSPLPSNSAEYVYFADDSTTWFATQAGFASEKNGVWNVYDPSNSPMCVNDIESMLIDDNCNLWVCADGALIQATFDCGLTDYKIVSGTVLKSNNSPAQNGLVYVYQLNANGTEYIQIDNIYTDNLGHFSYFTNDSGQFSFMAATNKQLFPGQIGAYADSALVIQDASSISMNVNGNYPVNIKMQQVVASSGINTLNGKLQSATERIGSVRLLLMLNNQPVASTLSNVDGTFKFTNIAAATYTIWVDKLGLDNLIAPPVYVDSATNQATFFFELFNDHLSLLPTGINTHDLNSCVSIFPNPFTHQISVAVQKQDLKQSTIEIRNLLGQPVYSHQQKCSGNIYSKTIDLYFLSIGIYLLDLNLDGERSVYKIVKQ